MTGVQGTSTVTYGAPVPPVPAAIPPMLQTPGAPLIPPSFFPNARGVQVDPNLLLYQTMGYYNPAGLPFSDGQNLPDFRAAGIQRGEAFFKNFIADNFLTCLRFVVLIILFV